jgi:predicted site-specific integrase-resolvase
MNEYKPASFIQKTHNISTSALRVWGEKGKIRFIRYTERGKRFYNIEDINNLLCEKSENKENDQDLQSKIILYARVSSLHQKEDLERQKEILVNKYPNSEIISDVGSTLNYKRKGLRKLLETVFSKNVKKVVILYKDRLCRFAFDLFESIFKFQGVEIEVVSKQDTPSQKEILPTSEMGEDIINIINYFTAKNNGLRSRKNKILRDEG